MSVRQNKNKKFLSSLLCALFCSSNSNMFSIMERPNLAEEYLKSVYNRYEQDRETSMEENRSPNQSDNSKILPWVKGIGYVLGGLLLNKKLFLGDSSFLDDIWSGLQWCGGYSGASELAKVLGLNYSQLAKTVTLGNKELNATWAEKLGKLADELRGNNGWVSTPESLSTYWQLTLLASSDLDLSFGENTIAFFKKFLSNQSPLGTSLLVDKDKTFKNGIVKPFTEDGGYLEDGLTTFKGKDSDYWFASAREWLIRAKKSRSALFSRAGALIQTFYVFYKRKMWDNNRCGDFNGEGKPNVLPSDMGTPICIYEDKKPSDPPGRGIYVNKGKWAWQTSDYVYVRVPCAMDKEARWNGIPVWNDDLNAGGKTAAQKFVDDINGARSLAAWLTNSNDLSSKQPHCRYIAIPLK